MGSLLTPPGKHITVISVLKASLIFVLLWGVCASPTNAESSLAAAKLEAIKQSLIDLAMKSNVQLGSTAYLDNKGVLYESSILLSDADIRGIRVLSYSEEAGIRTADVSANVFSLPQCPGTRPDVKRQALIRVRGEKLQEQSRVRVGDHYIGELLHAAESMLLAELTESKDWLVVPEVTYPTVYDQYVSGRIQDRAAYRFDIVISEKAASANGANQFLFKSRALSYDMGAWVAGKIPEVNYNKPWPKKQLVYELVLVDHQTNTPLWRRDLPLAYPRVDRGYHKISIPASVTDQIGKINGRLIEQATQAIDCHTDYFRLAIIPGTLEKFKIASGSSAGISVGDQFLISANANILSQSLSLSGLAELGLAQVESVTKSGAILRYLAGPKLQGIGSISNSVALHF
jgi:hypothetical protein